MSDGLSEPAEAIRRAYPSVLAKTLRFTRSLDDAQDAVHDAIERALKVWPSTALPDSPEAWLITVAANAHRDRLRRARKTQPHADALEMLDRLGRLSPKTPLRPWSSSKSDLLGGTQPQPGWNDDLLRLLYWCCAPELDEGESAALALSTVLGLSTHELAQAFVVAPRTMEQRLTRARQRLRGGGDAGVLDELDLTPQRARERTGAVLRTTYLLFNEGYWSGIDDAPIRADLCDLALGLARSLAQTYPDEPEVTGLLALLMLHEARRSARLGDDGQPVALPQQDRTRWDHDRIRAADALLRRALAAGRPGPMQLEAAIAAVHCNARAAEDTDWADIAALYALLEQHRPTPAVRVNHAFALARAAGVTQGLALLDQPDIDTHDYPYARLVRGTLLAEAGRTQEAIAALEAAEAEARNGHERRQIRARLDQLIGFPSPLDR